MRAWLLRGTLALLAAPVGGCLVSDVFVDGPGDAGPGAGGSGGGSGAGAGGASAGASGDAGAGAGGTGGAGATGGSGGAAGGPTCGPAACPTALGVAACCLTDGTCGYEVGGGCWPTPACDASACGGADACCTAGDTPVCGRQLSIPELADACEANPLRCGTAQCSAGVIARATLTLAAPCCADAVTARCGLVVDGLCRTECDLDTCQARLGGNGCCTGASLEQCGVRQGGQCVPGAADPCSPSPCQNGGVCQTMGGAAFVCQCPPPWSGTYCDQPATSPCSPNPCNNGSCTVMGGTSYCSCQAGWGGQWCDVRQCTPGYCQNGGTCSVVGGVLSCACLPGFTGPTCATVADPCSPNPCLHGSCSAGVGAYTCACFPGWEGTQCDRAGDCVALPCQNGGACTELPGTNAFSCTCTTGFTGPRCETGTLCSPNPCLNGGTCSQAGSSAFCACTSNYSGPRCEACRPGTGDCDGVTANGCEVGLDASAAHCGACGNACSQVNGVSECISGSCVLGACAAGWGNCDGSAANGCEVSLSSLQHCGACWAQCPSYQGTPACTGGACSITCNAGFGDCDGIAATGCEVDLRTTASACGSCGNVCSVPHGSPGCMSGACFVAGCESDWGDCDGVVANGCERDRTTVTDCGACGVACNLYNAIPACVAGWCRVSSCQPGWADCDGDDATGCESNLGWTQSCGACGATCTAINATPTCTGGSCGYACWAGYGDCDGQGATGCETDLTTDSAHCGACDAPCTVGGVPGVCVGGLCTTDVRAAEVTRWELDVPGPWLALWEDGDVLAASGTDALLVDRDTGVGAPRPGLTSRPALFLDGTSASAANGGYQGRHGVHQDGSLAWQWPDLGCCNSEAAPLLIDTAGRAAWVSANGGLSRVSVDTGVGAGVVSGGVWGGVDSARGDRHWVAGFQGALSLYDRAGPAHVWSATLDAGVRLLPGAVASSGALVVGSASGRIARYLPAGGSAWDYTAAPTTPAVIDDGDVAFVGTIEPSVIALTAAGAQAWRFPLLDPVSDLLVADDGTLHVLDTGGTITVLVRSDGSVQRRYVGLRAGGGELLLRDGVLHVTSGNRLYSLDVPPRGYPAAAAWPVRHHDNQRTGSGDTPFTW